MARCERGNGGRVYLVGAGPGDPRLITLRGVECLRQADLVFYDCLVDRRILSHACPSAEVVCAGQSGAECGGQGASEDELLARTIEAVRAGRAVVYLKGGDPEVFGRGGGQTVALRAAGIVPETVPGVTAALAAAGYAEIPITHAGEASAVALVTARQRRDATGPALDYGALAAFPGTLVVYMGVETAAEWSQALMLAGKPAATPVAVVARCSWPEQETIRCTLGTVAEVVAGREVRQPTVIIVGEVVSLAPEVSWFAARELFGQRILLTRPRDQIGPMWEWLADLGAELMVQPAIRIGDPPDWAPVDAALAELERYGWLVFSSANGVRYLLERLLDGGGDLRRLTRSKLACIGPATAEELGRYHLRADLVPGEYRAEALAEALMGRCLGGDAEGGGGETEPPRFLLARASRGREVLAERLRAAGGVVDQVVVYSSTDVEQADEEVAVAMSAGRIDWVTVTSSAIARSLVALFGEELRKARLASISPVTSETLRRLGHEPAAEATEYTTEGLVEAIRAGG